MPKHKPAVPIEGKKCLFCNAPLAAADDIYNASNRQAKLYCNSTCRVGALRRRDPGKIARWDKQRKCVSTVGEIEQSHGASA